MCFIALFLPQFASFFNPEGRFVRLARRVSQAESMVRPFFAPAAVFLGPLAGEI